LGLQNVLIDGPGGQLVDRVQGPCFLVYPWDQEEKDRDGMGADVMTKMEEKLEPLQPG